MNQAEAVIHTDPKRRAKLLFIFGVIITVFISMSFVAPIAQDQGYHNFADARALLGVQNFWNVLSNLPFMIVGIMGFRLLLSYRTRPVPLRTVYWVFFIGVFFVAFGSGYYHLSPDNESLMWDRLPMTVAFMAFFSAMISLCVNINLGPRLLIPLLVIGIFSVIYWHFTEQAGEGDLRLYVMVQFLPMLLIPIMLILFSNFIKEAKYIWLVLLAYAISKILEFFDMGLYNLFAGQMSGHALKHVAAAFGPYFFYLYLKHRYRHHIPAQ
ncbi:ceramidase domain-containing protein [Kaarinaea lacus]